MAVFKVTPVLLLVLVVGAEKKIELQDIEEDNLKSEKQKEYETLDPRSQTSGPGPVSPPLDFLKSGFFRYLENNPSQPSQPTRFVQQYAVTEVPERGPVSVPKVQYNRANTAPQQAMVGYLSNVPMQIYLVPQYYNEGEQGPHAQTAVHYTTAGQYTNGLQYSNGPQYTSAPQQTHGVARVAGYPSAPEAVQTQTNYIEVPAYVAPTAKTYVQQYSPAPVAYVSYTPQPTVAPAPTIAPVVTYHQVPVVQYPTAVATQSQGPKNYYQNTHYQDNNVVEEVQQHSHVQVEESPQQYSHTEVSYSKAPGHASDYPRFYSARPPPRDEYRHSHVPELPHPNPLLLKGPPSHLAHIPKALPMYRPLNKPIYGPLPTHGVVAPRPSEHHPPPPFKRRPTSLLDSYVPSSLQIEYMKRGFTNDPLQAYEALSSGHHYSHAPIPRQFERGFLPNQMYHTAGGGVTFGHYKRAPKADYPFSKADKARQN